MAYDIYKQRSDMRERMGLLMAEMEDAGHEPNLSLAIDKAEEIQRIARTLLLHISNHGLGA